MSFPFGTVASVAAAVAAFVSASEGSTTGTSLSVPYPAGLQAGDILVLWIGSAGNGTFTTPSGWSVAISSSSGRAVYYKVATGSESGSLSVSVQSDSNSAKCGIMACVRDATTVQAGTVGTNSTGDIDAPSITAAGAGVLLAFASHAHRTDTVDAYPSGMTSMGVNPNDSSGGDNHASASQSVGAYKNSSAAGATGAKNFDWSAADDNRAVLVQVY
jgi:hypothetical protein